MQNKSNEDAPQETASSRTSNAELVELNIEQLLQEAKAEKAWIESDRHSLTLFKSDTMRIMLMCLHEGTELKTHEAKGVISVQVLEGKINFATGHQTVLLQKGGMLALQESIPHSVRALEDSFFLLTLSLSQKQ